MPDRLRVRVQPTEFTARNFQHKVLRELKKIKLAWAGVDLLEGSGRPNPLALNPDHRTARTRPARKLISPFQASQRPVSGLSAPGWTLRCWTNLRIFIGRKSPISTGLCDSWEFSHAYFEYLDNPDLRLFRVHPPLDSSPIPHTHYK